MVFFDRADWEMVVLELPEQAARKRLALRGRDDEATDEQTRSRFRWWAEKTALAIELLEKKGRKVHRIDGSLPVECVHRAILGKLGLARPAEATFQSNSPALVNGVRMVSQVVYAMCGLAFSGKSTVAATIARELGTEVVSLDAINADRGLHGGEGIPDKQWEETSFIAMDRLRALLQRGRSVVVDDTFSHRFLRDRCKKVADECGSRFLIVFIDTPLSVIEARRAANYRNHVRHHIRDEVFRHHRDRFQYPTDDEPVVRISNDGDVERLVSGEKAMLP